MDERHPLLELEAVQAHSCFERIQRILLSYGLRAEEGRRFNNPQATEDELYELGRKGSPRLVWGWTLRPDLGVILKVLYEVGNSSIFVSFRQDSMSWVVGSLPLFIDGLEPSVRAIWESLVIPDPENLDHETVYRIVDVLARNFRQKTRLRFAC